jgi:choice-of-anchor A domain-containing protein
MKFFRNSAVAVALSLACASSASASPIDLGSVGAYTLLGAGVPFATGYAGTVNLGSAANVFGSVGGRRHLNIAPAVVIAGDLNGGTVSASPDIVVGGSQSTLSPAQWTAEYQDLTDASLAASALPNQQTVPSITSTLTLSAQPGGLSVFHVQGSFNLGSGESLILSGGFSDRFVINVDTGMLLGSGAAITLSGLQAENVLFNFTSASASDAAIIGAAAFSGNFIAPHMFWQIGDGATMPATRILVSGVQANLQDMTPPAPIPEPGTAILFAVGIAGLALRRQR